MNWLAKLFEDAALCGGGALACYLLLRWKERTVHKAQSLQALSTLENARREAEAIRRDARLTANEESLKLREETERSLTARRTEQLEADRRQAEREQMINTQLAGVMEGERELRRQRETMEKRAAELEQLSVELASLTRLRHQQLQAVAQLSEAEAAAQLRREIEQEFLNDASKLARQIIEDAKANAEQKARQIISVAIQRYAGDHTFENTTASIALSGEDIKGRIIGRDGRNIRAFEAATGVTVMIDDTPGAVVLSGFDPVRREVAREAMQRLIADGRIHPTAIEEIVTKVTAEMNENVLRLGEEAVAKVGVPPTHPEIARVLGRLHFRQSHSQNLLNHSIEVAHLMGLLAAELGVDVNAAKRAGLFHDIGKALTHEVEGPHAVVGGDLIRRHGESEEIANAVASHHNDVPSVGPLGILVSAADAISASRPGARSESMTTYVKRMEDLEKIAVSFPGVEKAFAVQAGRELRVFVQPEQVTDEQAFALARQVAMKIEDNLQYPGQIRVTIIRETRCVEVAK